MKVLARDINKKIPKEEAYRAPDRHYYSSEEAWGKISRERNFRKRAIEEIESILGYSYADNMPMPTTVYKKFQTLDGYGWESLYETIMSNKNRMEWTLNNKHFKTENGRINYIFAIIQNNIKEIYNTILERNKPKRLPVEEAEEINVQIVKQTEKDIRRFLDDE